LLLLGL